MTAAAAGMAKMSREQIAAMAAAVSGNPIAGGHPTAGMSLKKMPVDMAEPLRLEI